MENPDHNNRLFHPVYAKASLWISHREFNELGEYNTSLPTGTKEGKRWKRRVADHPLFPDMKFYWVGEYKTLPDTPEGQISIIWRKPILY